MSVIGLVFRFQVQQSEVDATYLLAGTILVTYVPYAVIELVQHSLGKPLTLHRTIEEEIGLMCTCMPFFPAIVNNSPTIQRYVHSAASFGSVWTFRSSRHGSIMDGTKNYQKHVSRDGSVEDGLELHGRDGFTDVALPESPKKAPGTGLGAFEGCEGSKPPYSRL